jgi:phospholipid/cholesterol/gamma-HCH transport system substrate-binding protein
MRGLSAGGRLAAIGALVGGIALVALLLFGGGGSGYSVRIEFRNAGQLVKGDEVQVGGAPVGSVQKIKLAPNGIVVVTATVDEPFAPLRNGTRATIRQVSQAGIANRYVDLALPSGTARDAGQIADGGTIDAAHTTTIVDLDQVFAIFDKPTRHAVQELLARSHEQYRGRTDELRALYLYLNPSLSTSNELFREVNRDTDDLERFIVGSGRLVTALADRRTDLAGAVTHLNTTFRSIGDERLALAEALRGLPPFMRQANTTFVDLRAALDDVDPLVAESKPVARKLRPLLDDLRPLARDARPTVRSLREVVSTPGAANDLTDLTRSFPALERIALERERRSVDAGGGPTDVGTVDGAFPETATALRDSAPVIAFGRPYTPELVGWFDDFSTSGATDALGGITRVLTTVNAISPLGAVPALIPLGERGSSFGQLVNTKQYKRCPGAAEVPAADGSNVPTEEEQRQLDCREEDRAAGQVSGP